MGPFYDLWDEAKLIEEKILALKKDWMSLGIKGEHTTRATQLNMYAKVGQCGREIPQLSQSYTAITKSLV